MLELKNVILYILLSVFTSCSVHENPFEKIKVISNSNVVADLKPVIEKVELDSIYCSYNGFSGITPDGNIYYFDRYFGNLYTFDKSGNFISKTLGLGRSDKETTIREAVGHAFTEGHFVLAGSNLDFEIFNSELKKEKTCNFPFKPDITGNAENFETYSFAFGNPVFRLHDGIFYAGMHSENMSFNYFDQPNKFLTQSCHIGRINLKEEKYESMILSGFPPIYLDDKDKYASMFYVNFDISRSDDLYVSFEADSLIYKCTLSGKPLEAFGKGGCDMDMDYKPVHSWEEMDIFSKNRMGKGRYSWVEYIDETGLLFRSYIKGDISDTDGLQIYRDGIMLADMDVPKGFRVTGYIAPYYYSQVFEDESEEKLYIFKINL